MSDFERLFEGLEDPRAANVSHRLSDLVLIMISARKRFYSLQTGNYIPADKTKEIQKRLDDINSIDQDELRKLYKRVLAEQEFSDKGTGGLGFIDIARKTGGQKLRYKFQPVTDKVSYFTFQIRLPRVEV